MPIKIPPGVSAEQANGIIQYLQANPEAAKLAYQQAQSMMQAPGFASAMLQAQVVWLCWLFVCGVGGWCGMAAAARGLDGGVAARAPTVSPRKHKHKKKARGPAASPEVLEALRGDPELSHMFDDVRANGASALKKYWEDTELMSKISARMRALQVGGEGGAGGSGEEASGEGGEASAASAELAEGRECVICLSAERDTTVLPCRHMCMCHECATALKTQTNKCPVCRADIESLLHIRIQRGGKAPAGGSGGGGGSSAGA